MADNCITCERPVTSRQRGIQCDVCSKWNHGTCITGKNFSTRLSSRCTHSYRDRLGLHSLSVFLSSGRELQNIYD
ncbi:unnamed protein product [Pocillopora meandrina]|uniref:Zinc finger PHD-type domain-containing protein n=1 Tax=Pocillopora meandrina TaxID=46732 RepID=A0AAU9W078_9CNID|nr:unnamed protein product [Pocillopora meandrina]